MTAAESSRAASNQRTWPQCTPTGRYRLSSHQEDCCPPHGTHTTDARHQLFHHRPASRLKSQKSFMHTVTVLDSSASSRRLRLWKDSLTCQPPSKWDWRWLSLCWLWRTGSVGELLTDCAQGWAARKQR